MANYTVLARKYRPTTFEEVVGQDSVKSGMRNSILNNSIHPLYILSGTRGVGKTTIARVFTKAMNCENFAEHLEPCGHCEACKAIDEGSYIDLVEIDAASKNKVEDARELIESLKYPPRFAKYRVFIIDEVHMLSTASFNAFLKVFEEPPEYAKFILCTTEERKIPATILSRSIHYHLKSFTTEQIATQLTKILTREQIPFEAKAIQALAEAGNGSMRDCLSLADQAIAIGNQHVTTQAVYDMLGLINDSLPTDLVIALLQKDSELVQELFKKMIEQQTDWVAVTNQVLGILYQASIIPTTPPQDYQKYGINNELLIKYFAKPKYDFRYFVEISQVIYEIFNHALKLLTYNPHPSQVFHMSCIRALAFSSSESLETSVAAPQQVIVQQVTNKPSRGHYANTRVQPRVDYFREKDTNQNFHLNSDKFNQDIKNAKSSSQQYQNNETLDLSALIPNLRHSLSSQTATTEKKATEIVKETVHTSNQQAADYNYQQLAYTKETPWQEYPPELTATDIAQLATNTFGEADQTDVAALANQSIHPSGANDQEAKLSDIASLQDTTSQSNESDTISTITTVNKPVNTLVKQKVINANDQNSSSVATATEVDQDSCQEDTNSQLVSTLNVGINSQEDANVTVSEFDNVDGEITAFITKYFTINQADNDIDIKEQSLLDQYTSPAKYHSAIKKEIQQKLNQGITPTQELICLSLDNIDFESKFAIANTAPKSLGIDNFSQFYPRLDFMITLIQEKLTDTVPELELFNQLQLPVHLFNFLTNVATKLDQEHQVLYLDNSVKEYSNLEQIDKDHKAKSKLVTKSKQQVEHNQHDYATEIETVLSAKGYQVQYLTRETAQVERVELESLTTKINKLANNTCELLNSKFNNCLFLILKQQQMLPPMKPMSTIEETASQLVKT